MSELLCRRNFPFLFSSVPIPFRWDEMINSKMMICMNVCLLLVCIFGCWWVFEGHLVLLFQHSIRVCPTAISLESPWGTKIHWHLDQLHLISILFLHKLTLAILLLLSIRFQRCGYVMPNSIVDELPSKLIASSDTTLGLGDALWVADPPLRLEDASDRDVRELQLKKDCPKLTTLPASSLPSLLWIRSDGDGWKVSYSWSFGAMVIGQSCMLLQNTRFEGQ